MTYDEWKPIAAELLAAYPLLAIPPETLVKYANDLSDLDAHCVMVGCRAVVKSASFFPTIAQIREYAKAEAARFPTVASDSPRLSPAEHEASREESARLVAKWGPRIREILANARGPIAEDLGVVTDG